MIGALTTISLCTLPLCSARSNWTGDLQIRVGGPNARGEIKMCGGDAHAGGRAKSTGGDQNDQTGRESVREII